MTSPAPVTTLETARARNINLWKDAEVWVSDAEDPKVNPDGTFDTDWAFVGLLADGSEIGQEMDIERNDIKSFGGKKQMTDTKFNKDTRSFDSIEDNEVTFGLLWPGSEYVADGATVLMAPKTAASRFVAFKTKNSFGDIYVDITRRRADIYAPGAARGDDGAQTTSYTVDVMEDDKGALYDHLRIKNDGATVNEQTMPIRIKGVTASGPIDPAAVDSDGDGTPDATDTAPNDPLVQ